MQNGRLAFDVTELIEAIPFKAGGYEFTLPPDISLTDLTSVQRETQKIEKATTDETVDMVQAEENLWKIFERLMARAEPTVPKPVREMFTMGAMLSVLGFLLVEWGSAKNSITSLRSRTSMEEESTGETSSIAPSFSTADSG